MTGRTTTDPAEPEEIVTIMAKSAPDDDQGFLLTVGARTAPLPEGWFDLMRQVASEAKGERWYTLAWARRPSCLVEAVTPQHPTAETLLALRRSTTPGQETPWTLLGHVTAIGELNLIVTIGPPGGPWEWTVTHEGDPNGGLEGTAPTVELAKSAALARARGVAPFMGWRPR